MNYDLDLIIKTNTTFKEDISHFDVGGVYTIEMTLSRPNIERLRGYKWVSAIISVDPLAVTNTKELSLLEELIEIITLSTTNGLVWDSVTRVSEIEKIICNNYPTVELYFNQLPLLRSGKTNYWYLASSKKDFRFSLDEYEYALRKYTGDNSWHVSDITEHGKRSLVYEFTNTYDDLYY